LESQLGPVIDSVPDPTCQAAEVRVLVADSPPVAFPGCVDALDRKRRTIWRCNRRNAAVAEIAEALAAGCLEPLWQHGLLLDSDDAFRHVAGHGPRVAVLVESPEHGRALKTKLLPDWRLLTGVAAAEDRTAPLDRAIVTLVHAASLEQCDVDVLVRADAGTCSLERIKGFPRRASRETDRVVLLVDLGDDVDAVATATTRCRLRDYDRCGWQIEAPTRWMSSTWSTSSTERRGELL
jgi:hypothetical protein